MNRENILDAMGRIDDDVLEKVMLARSKPRRRPAYRRWVALAACFVMILSLTITAEATNGSVSNLLAPIFGGAQTEIVDQIGVPIGASTSVNGYTLTVDAIIGDRYSVMVGYTLSRDDGQPIPAGIDFRRTNVMASGYRTAIEIDESDSSVAHFHERWHRNEPILGRIVSPSFTDLIVCNEDEEDTMIAEGIWEVTFALRYPDTTEKLPVKSFRITDDGGQNYKVKNVMLSTLGIHLDLVFYEPDYVGGIFGDFEMSLIMKDGTELPLKDGGGGGGWKDGDKKADVDYYAEFDVPIPREDIEAILICGTRLDLDDLK